MAVFGLRWYNIKVKFTIKNPVIKKIFQAVAVAGFGFILLNLTFLLDFLYQSSLDRLIRIFTPADINMDMGWRWFPPARHAVFMVIVILISRFVFRSKLGAIYKAIFMTVPLAVIFATIGILFYRFPPAVYLLGGLFGFGVLYYLYRTKQSWIYYYTLILIGVTMLCVVIFGVEI